MANKDMSVVLRTISDFLLAILSIIPIYFYVGGLPPIASLLLLGALAAGVYCHFINQFDISKWKFIISSLVISLGVGVLFSYNIYLLLGCVLFVLRMGFLYFNNGTESANGIKVFVFTVVTVVYYVLGLAFNYPYSVSILLLFSSFLILYLLIRIQTGWFQSRLAVKQKVPFLTIIPFIIFGAWMGAKFIPYITPLVKLVFYYLISVPLGALAWLISPFLNWILGLELSEEQNMVILTEFNPITEETVTLSKELFFSIPLIVLLLTFIIVAWRGKIKKKKVKREGEIIYQNSKIVRTSIKSWVFNKEPEHLVRKKVWSLEKFAVKLKAERKWGETLEEWLDRIGVTDVDSARFIEIYNACRYGGKDISKTDIKWFENYTKLIKDSIRKNKDIFKLETENNKKQIPEKQKREKSVIDQTKEMKINRMTGV